jgi:hypothetical protein
MFISCIDVYVLKIKINKYKGIFQKSRNLGIYRCTENLNVIFNEIPR